MKLNDAFPSKYLKAADLQGKQVNVTIRSCQMELMRDDGEERKPILYFHGKDKGMVLNKTNFSVLADAYGDETDDWIGKNAILRSEKVTFEGKLVDSIRVGIPQQEGDAPF